MESLIDDEGAKRKVRGLIANIGNYGTRGDRGHLPSLARGAFILSQWDSTVAPVSVGAGAPPFGIPSPAADDSFVPRRMDG